MKIDSNDLEDLFGGLSSGPTMQELLKEHPPFDRNIFFDWTGIKNSEETKLLKSQKTKEFWMSEKGQEKRLRLIERNKTTHKETMIEKWKHPSEKMLGRKVSGRPSGAKDVTTRKQRTERKICVNGVIYDNAKMCSEVFGIHPVNVRRRCRMKEYVDWRYANENSSSD